MLNFGDYGNVDMSDVQDPLWSRFLFAIVLILCIFSICVPMTSTHCVWPAHQETNTPVFPACVGFQRQEIIKSPASRNTFLVTLKVTGLEYKRDISARVCQFFSDLTQLCIR